MNANAVVARRPIGRGLPWAVAVLGITLSGQSQADISVGEAVLTGVAVGAVIASGHHRESHEPYGGYREVRYYDRPVAYPGYVEVRQTTTYGPGYGGYYSPPQTYSTWSTGGYAPVPTTVYVEHRDSRFDAQWREYRWREHERQEWHEREHHGGYGHEEREHGWNHADRRDGERRASGPWHYAPTRSPDVRQVDYDHSGRDGGGREHHGGRGW